MADSTINFVATFKAGAATAAVDGFKKSLHGLHGAAGRAADTLKSLAATTAKLAVGGLVALAGGLVLATHAAADEQKGILRLATALKANIKNFKGNTDSIEALITKREALAFSDDELRDSLTVLVTKYHNVAKAEKIQAVAMDVARLKGISLGDATALVSKGMDGNVKILKQLGITLPKTATEQERLTAIQKKAAGQADAYGKSAAGSQEAFQIALGDVVEEVGGAFLPVMTTAFTWLRTDALPAILGVIHAIGDWIAKNRPLINQIGAFVTGALTGLVDTLGSVVTWIGSVVTAIADNKDAMNVLQAVAKGIGDAFTFAWGAIKTLIDWVATFVDSIGKNKEAMDAFHAVWDTILFVLGKVIDALKFIIDLAGRALEALGKVGKVAPEQAGLGQGTGGWSLGVPRAAGGWAGLHGPELTWLGEKGPEYVVPHDQVGRLGGSTVVHTVINLDGRKVAEVVSKHMAADLGRAAATFGRV